MYFLVSGLFKLLQTDLVLALIRVAGGGGVWLFCGLPHANSKPQTLGSS